MNPSASSAEDRTVLVTGASKRLGRSIALHLARNGWHVAAHYRQSAQEVASTVADCRVLGVRCAAFAADLAQDKACATLFADVVDQMGPVHAVVNSAALFEHDDVQTFDMPAMERHWRTNTAAPILLAQALAQHARVAGHHGVVVNLLDQKLWNLNPDFLSYTLSKAALEAATRMLALALAPQVRVVGVAPGLTLTSHMLSDERFEALHKQSPLGRSSTPEDVADAVAFALNNRSVTGTTLLVDGGQHLMRFERDFSLM